MPRDIFVFSTVFLKVWKKMRSYRRFAGVPILALFGLLASSCASLPDMNRIQGNMDAMVYNMGVMASCMPVMANSTSRMAQTAEQMQRKSNGLLSDLQKKGGTAERTIQNYSQALLDNERAVITSLKGIKQELSDLKLTVPGSSASPRDRDKKDEAFQARLNALEQRLAAIASKVEKLEGKPVHLR